MPPVVAGIRWQTETIRSHYDVDYVRLAAPRFRKASLYRDGQLVAEGRMRSAGDIQLGILIDDQKQPLQVPEAVESK